MQNKSSRIGKIILKWDEIWFHLTGVKIYCNISPRMDISPGIDEYNMVKWNLIKNLGTYHEQMELDTYGIISQWGKNGSLINGTDTVIHMEKVKLGFLDHTTHKNIETI